MHHTEVLLTKETLEKFVTDGLTQPQIQALKEQHNRQVESGNLPCEKES